VTGEETEILPETSYTNVEIASRHLRYLTTQRLVRPRLKKTTSRTTYEQKAR
jgi:hypothetical protein